MLLLVFAGCLLLAGAIHWCCLLAVFFLLDILLGLVFRIVCLIVCSISLLRPLSSSKVVHLVHEVVLLPLSLLLLLPLLLQLLLLLLELLLLGHVESAGVY